MLRDSRKHAAVSPKCIAGTHANRSEDSRKPHMGYHNGNKEEKHPKFTRGGKIYPSWSALRGGPLIQTGRAGKVRSCIIWLFHAVANGSVIRDVGPPKWVDGRCRFQIVSIPRSFTSSSHSPSNLPRPNDDPIKYRFLKFSSILKTIVDKSQTQLTASCRCGQQKSSLYVLFSQVKFFEHHRGSCQQWGKVEKSSSNAGSLILEGLAWFILNENVAFVNTKEVLMYLCD